MTTFRYTYHFGDTEYILAQQALQYYLNYCKRELDKDSLSPNIMMVETIQAILDRGPDERLQTSGSWFGPPIGDDDT